MSATLTPAEIAEEMTRDPAPLPGETRRVWVAYPPEIWLEMSKVAMRWGISVPALVRQAIREYIAEELPKLDDQSNPSQGRKHG